MTEHAPLPVAGYTPQNDEKIALANELKEAEERYLRILDKLHHLATRSQFGVAQPTYNLGMLQIAKESMQTANMWAVRALFQPTRVKLPEDN